MLDWLVPMLGLPEKFLSSNPGGGVIQDTASSAVLCALLAARERATNYTSNRKGCDGRIVAYASTQTHSSLEKAALIAGIGVDNLRLLEVDDKFAMRPDSLSRQIEADSGPVLFPAFSRHRGYHLVERDGPDPTIAHVARPTPIYGCIWTRPCPHTRFVQSSVTCETESNSPTATTSTRTNGCSRTSIAIVSGSPTARR